MSMNEDEIFSENKNKVIIELHVCSQYGISISTRSTPKLKNFPAPMTQQKLNVYSSCDPMLAHVRMISI